MPLPPVFSNAEVDQKSSHVLFCMLCLGVAKGRWTAVDGTAKKGQKHSKLLN